jgi:proteasome lid subunit RPN8/RPN11
MFTTLKRFRYVRQFSRPPRHRAIISPTSSRLVITEPALHGIRDCISREIELQHEGTAYLYGQTDGESTLVTGAIRPVAKTTAGSFNVTSVAMARIVRCVNECGLQLIGQAHSHPGAAFHSEGDDAGAKIAYKGFVSIVVPDYGVHLPSLERAAFYVFRDGQFYELHREGVKVVPRSIM